MAAKRPKEVQAAINKGKQAWKDARKTKPGSSDFSAPKLKKYGSHKCKWDAKYGLNKNEELYASLIWTIVSGADKGKSHNLYFAIQNDEDSEKAEKAMGRLAAAVQSLTGEDTSESDYADPSSLFDLLDQIRKDKPIAMADIKENGEYLNVYIGDLVDDEDSEEDEEEDEEEEEGEDYSELAEQADDGDKKAIAQMKKLAKAADLDPDDYETYAELAEALGEDSEEDEEEEEEEEEEKPKRGAKKPTAKKSSKSDDEDEEEEEDDEEEEDEVEPEVGDVVSYKPPKARKAITCEVKRINKRAKTCALQEEDGDKKFTDVAWDKLEY